MGDDALSAMEARERLYEVMDRDVPFEEKATLALSIGEAYLGAENGHLTRIDVESDYWKAIASTDSVDGRFPVGLQLDLQNTYRRRERSTASPVRLYDAPNQGWDDDPAFERRHGPLLPRQYDHHRRRGLRNAVFRLHGAASRAVRRRGDAVR